ncbi:hypothetical protein LCGC14_0423490 [marine sediment metagenome]|uniref:DNA-directed DNA polymerase family A palm domain-containing protein n=1 Tax=marine sediment metagenome TaxID=412755 RepID=A0A0F9VC87_9ZZZZ
MKLQQVNHAISRCNACPQRLTARHRAQGLGTDRAEIIVVTENPSAPDDREGRVGAGFETAFIMKHLQRLGMPLSKVYFTALVKCFPGFTRGVGFHDFHPDAIGTCSTTHLFDEIIAIDPKLIVTVGPKVTKFFDVKGGINSVSGKIHMTDLGPVLPLVNPVSLNKQGPRQLVAFVTSLRLMKLFAESGQLEPPPLVRYVDWVAEQESAGDVVGVDLETTWKEGMASHDPAIDIWSIGYGNEWVRNVEHMRDFVPVEARGEFPFTPVFHNASFDIEFLERDGWKVPEWYDTIIEAHLLGYGPLGLKKLMPVFTGHSLKDFKSVINAKKTYEDNEEEALDYCASDAWGTKVLHDIFWPEIKKRGLEGLYDLERKVTTSIRRMERKGIPIDQHRLVELRDSMVGDIEAKRQFLNNSGVPWEKDKDFAAWFWKGREKKAPKTATSKQLSCKKDDLLAKIPENEREDGDWEYLNATPDQLAVVQARVELAQKAKFIKTYLEHWIAGDGWVHPSFNQTGTVTWRFSCSDPNLQNVARIEGVPLHHLFVAPDGWKFISVDYSLLELVVIANLSKDPVMLDAFVEDRKRKGKYKKDIHQMRVDSLLMQQFFNTASIHDDDRQRTFAKTINYGIPYGLTGYSVKRRLKLKDQETGDALVQGFFDDFKAVKPWQDAQKRHGERFGYVKTSEGRPLYVPGIFAEWGRIKSRAENQTKNMPVQGTAAEIVKEAMVRCDEAIEKFWKGMAYIVSQIHDELLFLVRDDVVDEFKAFCLTTDGMLDTRHNAPYLVDAKVGQTWGELKQVDDPFAWNTKEEREEVESEV